MRYWIGVASKNHVARGVEGGFCQLCHGKAQPLKRMNQGDWIIYYSPKEYFEEKTPCQQFTAIGKVVGTEVYPFAITADFVPFRRDIEFIQTANSVDIRPLISHLGFIKDPKHWGAAFRFGYLEINQADFAVIAKAMLGVVPE